MVAGGEQSGYGILTVREQLWMFSQFYGLPSKDGWRRVDELIEAVGLDEQREQRVSTLSTGQRQKMNFARGLLNDPWIFFLDEPTLGLDVAAARSVRELVLAWKAAVPGRTVLLTTHYMAEADELCERIAIVDHGRILALGTPDELKRRVQRESVFRIELDRLDGGAGALRRLPGVVSAAAAADQADGRRAPDGRGQPRPRRRRRARRRRRRARRAAARTSSPSASREPSLEDVFVELVGRGFDEEALDETDASATASTTTTATTARARPDAGPPRHRPRAGRARGTARRSYEHGVRLSAPTASPQEAADWTPRQIVMTDLRTVVGRAYPRVTGLFREKSWVFFEILLPFLATSAFVFVYRALQAPPEYVGFVVLGGAMTAFWLNVIWMMASSCGGRRARATSSSTSPPR